jgi:hypothetical protein
MTVTGPRPQRDTSIWRIAMAIPAAAGVGAGIMTVMWVVDAFRDAYSDDFLRSQLALTPFALVYAFAMYIPGIALAGALPWSWLHRMTRRSWQGFVAVGMLVPPTFLVIFTALTWRVSDIAWRSTAEQAAWLLAAGGAAGFTLWRVAYSSTATTASTLADTAG